MRILLVDDSEDNRLLIQLYINKTPHELDTVVDGVEALEKFTAEPYDLVIMDMKMPVMDGYASSRKIREWEKENGRSETPILALTAQAQAGEMEKCLKAGCSVYLDKPIRLEKFLEVINKFHLDKISSASVRSRKDDCEDTRADKHTVCVDPDLEDLIPGYLDKRKEDIHALTQSLKSGDFESIRRVGHILKGSGESYGFHGLSEIGTILEKSAKEESAERIESEIQQLTDYLERLTVDYRR